MIETKRRCPWAGNDPVYIAYHDDEWGTPVRDSKKLFEALILDGAQAGLSWITILKRRDGYRRAFDNFDPVKIAAYTEKDIKRLMADHRIIRNKQKIISTIENAKAYCKMADADINFSDWLWAFVDYKTIIHRYKTMEEVPANTMLSDKIAKELKNQGFSFVGPTIIYAFMQAVGMANDHLTNCFKHPDADSPQAGCTF
ncbi:MAG: DNA-3-methyladenine glycosylase I [Treponema sp.]|jgi:DNA-3-methyladenine glycosylase I|nr:DNA-3-methyladenine glycosylase I [Treponema sp.]